MSELDHEHDLKSRVAEYLSAIYGEIAVNSKNLHWIPILVRFDQMATDINVYGWHQILGMEVIETQTKCRWSA